MMKVFIEEQRFTQLWLHILLWISFGIPLFMLIYDWIYGAKQNSETSISLVVVMLTFFISYGFILILKLKTRIDEKGINYRFIPFHFSYRTIAWNHLEKAYVRKYDALADFGGWGLKGGRLWDKSKGMAYNVKGDMGLQLELKNGKKILIGTQKEEEIKRVLLNYGKMPS